MKLIKNSRILLIILIGIVLSSTTVYAGIRLMANEVSYSNIDSQLTSSDVQSAIDEIYNKATVKLEEAKSKCPEGYECKEKVWKLVNDVNSNGLVDLGDEINIIGTDENFYVISNENGEIAALAKYNLDVGNICVYNSVYTCTPISNPTGIQKEIAKGFTSDGYVTIGNYGTIDYSNTNGWSYENDDNIDLKVYDGSVKEALYGINGYEKYLQQFISSVNVRLLRKKEIEFLINDGELLSSGSIKEKADMRGFSWLYATTYWSGSARSINDLSIWIINTNGSLNSHHYDKNDVYGLRPVIIFSAI